MKYVIALIVTLCTNSVIAFDLSKIESHLVKIQSDIKTKYCDYNGDDGHNGDDCDTRMIEINSIGVLDSTSTILAYTPFVLNKNIADSVIIKNQADEVIHSRINGNNILASYGKEISQVGIDTKQNYEHDNNTSPRRTNGINLEDKVHVIALNKNNQIKALPFYITHKSPDSIKIRPERSTISGEAVNIYGMPIFNEDYQLIGFINNQEEYITIDIKQGLILNRSSSFNVSVIEQQSTKPSVKNNQDYDNSETCPQEMRRFEKLSPINIIYQDNDGYLYEVNTFPVMELPESYVMMYLTGNIESDPKKINNILINKNSILRDNSLDILEQATFEITSDENSELSLFGIRKNFLKSPQSVSNTLFKIQKANKKISNDLLQENLSLDLYDIICQNKEKIEDTYQELTNSDITINITPEMHKSIEKQQSQYQFALIDNTIVGSIKKDERTLGDGKVLIKVNFIDKNSLHQLEKKLNNYKYSLSKNGFGIGLSPNHTGYYYMVTAIDEDYTKTNLKVGDVITQINYIDPKTEEALRKRNYGGACRTIKNFIKPEFNKYLQQLKISNSSSVNSEDNCIRAILNFQTQRGVKYATGCWRPMEDANCTPIQR